MFAVAEYPEACDLLNIYSENESNFEKFQHFTSPKTLLLSKISKNWTYLTRISEFLRKTILHFTIFMMPYKSREILGGYYDLLEKSIKNALKIA